MENKANSTVLYIVGAGRSGSTLIERIFGIFTGWVNVGELVGIFRRLVLFNERCGVVPVFVIVPSGAKWASAHLAAGIRTMHAG